MTAENCLRLAKELGDKGDSQNSLFYLNRGRHKVAKHAKYSGMKVEGFKLVEDKPEPKPEPKPKAEEKKSGKKSKG